MPAAPFWLIALLFQAPVAPPAPTVGASGEAARLRDAGQSAIRQWVGCIVEGGRARAAAGATVEAAVAAAQAGCAAQREAAARAIEAAERAAGNPVTEAQVAELVGGIERMIGSTAPGIVRGHLTRKPGKKKPRR